MGYYTRYTGEILINPPLRWEQIKGTPWVAEDQWPDLRIEVDEEENETATGFKITKEGVAVVPASENSYKGYGIIDTLQTIVDTFPEHEFVGSIRCEGEETGDLWKLTVVDRKATEIRPQIIWPDGVQEAHR